MKKKILSITLAMAMVTGALASCGSKTTIEENTASTMEEMQTEVEETSEENLQESSGDNGEKPQLLAAMCKVDITPTINFSTAGYSDGGITGANFCTPEEHTSDLAARVLLMEYDGVRMLHVNFETLSSSSIMYLMDEAGADRKMLSASCTHNHQAMAQLTKDQEKALEAAVQEAAANLVPVNIGIDTYGTQYGVSRSPSYSLDLESPYDNTVTIVRLDNAQTDEPIGLIYNVPIHNTAFGNSKPENWKYLNCEFTGYASRYLEEQYSEYDCFTAMHINGFFGNSGPYFADKEPGIGQYTAYEVEELKAYGEDFGQEIQKCYEEIAVQPAYDYPIMSYSCTDQILKSEDPKKRSTWGGGEASTVMYQTMSFGEVAFIGVNGEPFSTIGAHLRAEAPFAYLLPTACVNGSVGYIPLYETFHNGRNEVETMAHKSPFDDTAEAVFYEQALNALCDLKGVDYERTLSILASSDEMEGKRIYTFDFAKEIMPDKLVLSFGQTSRLDCAQEFTLEVYDQAGNLTYTVSDTDNSVNYLGYLTENVKAAKAVLTVSSTYLSESPKDITVQLHAMNYIVSE